MLAKLDGGGIDASAAIIAGLNDPAAQVRAAAIEAVVVVERRRNAVPAPLVAALVKQLSAPDPRWADRRLAVLALGRLGGDTAATLAKAAKDTSSFVREAVAQALPPGAVDLLLELSRDEVAQVRAAAATTLKASPDERARKRRAELTQDPDLTVRAAAN